MDFLRFFGFKKVATFDSESAVIDEMSKNVALKKADLEKNAIYIARGVSKAKFWIKGSSDGLGGSS